MKIFKDTEMVDMFLVLDFIFFTVRGAVLGFFVGAIVAAACWFWR